MCLEQNPYILALGRWSLTLLKKCGTKNLENIIWMEFLISNLNRLLRKFISPVYISPSNAVWNLKHFFIRIVRFMIIQNLITRDECISWWFWPWKQKQIVLCTYCIVWSFLIFQYDHHSFSLSINPRSALAEEHHHLEVVHLLPFINFRSIVECPFLFNKYWKINK